MQAAAFNPHERFEELAALALIGELSAPEHQELHAHLKSCEPCRKEYEAYEGILSHQLPLLHSERSSLPRTDQFDFRTVNAHNKATPKDADRVSILFPVEPQLHRDLSAKNIVAASLLRSPVLMYGLTGILAVALAILTFYLREQGREAKAQIATLKGKIAILNTEVKNWPPIVMHDPAEPLKEVRPPQAGQSARLMQRARDLEAQLSASTEEINWLKDQLQTSDNSDKALAQRLAETQQELDRAATGLQAVSSDRDQTAANLKNKETELLALEQEVSTLREAVDRDRALLAASFDITSLMGARNLRIIDVSDVDGNGKTRRAFGRVFFTEGKSLVFYAFDLTDAKSSARPASFQAWGSQGANLPRAKSLGIFFHDDHSSNRWVLKFDDSRVLSEIDSVFVTVEPLGGSKRPTGTPLLPAYLKAELNHP